jgi:ABC-2 type transport system permease protein
MKIIFSLFYYSGLQQIRDYYSLFINVLTTPILFIIYFTFTNTTKHPFVPVLILLSSLMVVFSTAMVVAYEVENRTIFRFSLAEIPFYKVFIGLNLFQILLGSLSEIFLICLVCLSGIIPISNLPTIILYCFLMICSSSLFGSIIGATSGNVFRAFSLASFVMFLLLFLSGGLFPLPEYYLTWDQEIRIDLMNFIPSNAFLKLIFNTINILETSKQESLFLNMILILSIILSLITGIKIFQIAIYHEPQKK